MIATGATLSLILGIRELPLTEGHGRVKTGRTESCQKVVSAISSEGLPAISRPTAGR